MHTKISCSTFSININTTDSLLASETTTVFRNPMNMMTTDSRLVWPEGIIPYNYDHGIGKYERNYNNVYMCVLEVKNLWSKIVSGDPVFAIFMKDGVTQSVIRRAIVLIENNTCIKFVRIGDEGIPRELLPTDHYVKFSSIYDRWVHIIFITFFIGVNFYKWQFLLAWWILLYTFAGNIFFGRIFLIDTFTSLYQHVCEYKPV